MRSSTPDARNWEKDRSRLNHDRLKNQLTQELFYIVRVLESGVDDAARLRDFARSWGDGWRELRADIVDLLRRYPKEASPASQYDFSPFEDLLPEERARMKREADHRWALYLEEERPIDKVTDASGEVADAWGAFQDDLRAANGKRRFDRARALKSGTELVATLRALGAEIGNLSKDPF